MMKKVKYLLACFMAFMLVGAIRVNAETYSETFKAILNDNDKITLTNNGMNSKDTLILMYIDEFNNNHEGEYHYFIDVSTCSNDYSECNVQMNNRETNEIVEEHVIVFNYNEVYSDEFQNILSNGSLIVKDSTLLDSKFAIISNTLEKYRTDDYYFQVNNESECSEDYSKCNVVCYLSNGTQEQHVVNVEYTEEYSDEFKQFINDGKIVITDSTLNGNIDLITKYFENNQKENYIFEYLNCNSDNSKCDVRLINLTTNIVETHTIDIVNQESYSDDYNKFANNGEITVSWSIKGDKNLLITDYINSLSDNNYRFYVQNCNSDSTKCDGVLYNSQTNKNEMHIVTIKYEEKYSDDFKKITTDGNIVITSSTTGSKRDMLSYYFSSIQLSEGKIFRIDECDNDATTCTIVLSNNTYQTLEKHLVKIKYEEKYSEEFKKLTEDGNIVITSSGEKQSLVSEYANGFRTETISFNIGNCNDDYTVCTATMSKNENYTMLEQHVVNISYEERYSDEFKKITTDGKLVVEAITPEDFDAEFLLTAKINDLIDTSKYNGYGSCNENNECTITIYSIDGKSESHIVKISFVEPSKEVQKIVNDAVKDMKVLENSETKPYSPKDGYILDDLYLINFYNTISDNYLFNYGDCSKALKFSKELIELTKGSNLSFGIDLRLGDGSDLWSFGFGKAIVYYDGVAYASVDAGTTEIHVLYIPDDTKNTKEAYVKAAQTRIDNYFGKNDIKVTYAGSLDDLDEYNKEYGLIDFSKTDGNYYNIKIGERDYSFVLVKASQDKLVEPTYIGSDIMSNVSVSSEESEIPLDTSLTVQKIENERIEKAVNTKNYLAYDIKLYSSSKSANITKLSNGKFKVSIPVSESLNGKEVTTYYINDNNELTEYETTVENGFATFETDHFSVYTLVEKKKASDDNSNTNKPENSEEVNNGNSTVDKNEVTEENPQTYDGIMTWVILGLVSISGIIGIVIYRKKQNI